MSAIAFDTLAYAKRMRSVGFTEEQAEAQAEEMAKLLDQQLATKQDIVELKAHIAEAKVEMIKWVLALMLAQTGIILAVLKLF